MRVVFGECEFDSGRRVLIRHGRATPLSPKAFQLLELLLDRRPEAVAKTELVEHLWPETFVSDASLHNLVAEVRAAARRYAAGGAVHPHRSAVRLCLSWRCAACASVTPAPSPGHARPRLVSGSREWLLSEGPNWSAAIAIALVRIDSATVSRRTPESCHERRGHGRGSGQQERNASERAARHAAVALKDGDQVQIGSVTLTYRILDGLPSTVTRLA